MKNETVRPTDSELEILQVIWKLEEATVKDIHDKISQSKPVGRTTILKLVQIMFEKKYLTRRKEGKGHIYKSVIAEGDVQKSLLNKVLDKAFLGSTSKLVMNALGNTKTTQQELDQIKEFISQQEKNLKS